MPKYAIGPAYGGSQFKIKGFSQMIPPKFSKFYKTQVEARKELYKELIKSDARDTLWIYSVSKYSEPTPYLNTKQIGFAYATKVSLEMKYNPNKKYVIFENMNGKERHQWYLNKDGTLGKRRP